MWLPPLLLIPLIAYNLVAFNLVSLPALGWNEPLLTVAVVSGAAWSLSIGDALLVLALALLFFEVVRSTRSGTVSILDHGFSSVVFVVYLVEFLAIPAAATSLFFICMAMSFIDVVAGFSISIRTAQRDINLGS
jgi:hypothetical protein